MGLDQFAYAADGVELDENGQLDVVNSEEIAYWRKHNRLHGWMERLWNLKSNPLNSEKNPCGNDFNCVPVELTLTDLEQLEAAVHNKGLPATAGFFFGNDSYAEYENPDFGYKAEDVDFIEKARKAIKDGKKVFYNCWW